MHDQAHELTRPGALDRAFGFRGMRFRDTDAPKPAMANLPALMDALHRRLLAASSAQQRPAEAPRATPTAPAGSDDAAALSKSELVELATQTWRLERRVASLDPATMPREQKQFSDSLRRFQRIMAGLGLEIHDPIGERYVDGWVEVEVVAWEECNDRHPMPDVIKQTIAPIVRRGGQVMSRGQVIATYANADGTQGST
jgi:hypothetical protein